MKPKQKAKELIDKFYNLEYPDGYKGITEYEAKYCALTCVDEILNDNPNIYDSDRLNHNYWKEVKTEIEKL